MQKNYNLRLIKYRHSYTFEEITKLLKVHQRTIQTWKNEGLNMIDSIKPYLVMGYDLKEFLNKKLQSRKIKLESNQFYCTKCRQAVTSKNNQVKLIETRKLIGNKNNQELIITGECEKCGTKLNRFSHSGKLNELKENFNILDFGGLDCE